MKCTACGAPYHEATGHRHSDRTVLCGVCARSFAKWVKAQLSRRVDKVRFYDYAVTHKVPKE